MNKAELGSFPESQIRTLTEEDVQYEIVLPDSDSDFIQQKIFSTSEPYELDMLRDMRARIGEEDLVLDVGANIGNHSLYIASTARAHTVAFEPNVHLCSALRSSIIRNGLENLITVQNIGLGRVRASARFERQIPENLGAQALITGEGDIDVVPLDSLEFDRAVRAIKIDVEGMELDVIQGGRQCIERDRPLLYVECRNEAQFRRMLSWAQTHRYTYWETFNATPTHLFLPTESISLDERIDHLNAHNGIREYRLIEKLRHSRQIEEDARKEIERLAVERQADIKALEEATIVTIDGLKEEIENERDNRKEAESSIETVRSTLTEQLGVLDRTRIELESERDQLHAYAAGLEYRLLALLNSRTWRVLEPVRMILRLVKGRKQPEPFTSQLPARTDTTPAKPASLNAADIGRKLWSGFSKPALKDLKSILNNSSAGRSNRVKAAWHLARWTAASGDWKSCLTYLGKIAYLDKNFYRTMRPRVLVIEANLRVGEMETALEYVEYGLKNQIDGNFVCGKSNALLLSGSSDDVDEERLALINMLYEDAGLVSIALRDPSKGFVFGNLISDGRIQPLEDGPKTSVLVPVYNAEDFVETAIESLLSQSWRNLEVIAVDDASKDDSWEILQRLAKNDSRLRIFRNDTNLGAYPTRNRALGEATGDIITVHDSDDWSHPQMIEIQVQALLKRDDIKITYSMMTRVLPNMEFKLRPERSNLEYVHRSYPSLTIRRADLDKLGRWDDVAANADDELVQRARVLWGESAQREVLPLTPLSYFLRHDQSLTEQKGTHLKSLDFGIRNEYSKQARHWREETTSNQTVTELPIARSGYKSPFPIPAGLAPRNWKRDPVYDLVIISDLGLLGGTRRCNEGYIAAATELGFRVGLFHWPRYDLKLTEIAPEYRRLSYQSNVDILVPEDEVECDTVIIHHPPILKYPIDDIPNITAERVGILVNQLPMQRRSTQPHYYFPDEVASLCQNHFNREPVWIPISATTRRFLTEIGGFICLDGDDWIPPLGRTLDADRVPNRNNVGSDRQIVLGRHSRDHITKWPTTPAKLRAAYCADTDISVRLMGGVRTPRRMLGQLPANWTTVDFDETPVAGFIASLDFFVHFIDEDYIEEFGRGTMEAMAAGVPALLPPVFREIFGEAAVYCEPEEVTDIVHKLWSDPDAYRDLLDRGYNYVRTNCDQQAVMNRLQQFVQRRTNPHIREPRRQ